MQTEVRLAILLGGAVGTGLRLLVDALVPVATFPLATLLVNLVGAYVLGRLAGAMPHAPPRVRAFVGTGVLGSFTTFSAVAVDLVALGGRPLVLATYAVATLAGGLGAARLGRAQGAEAAAGTREVSA